MTVRSGTQRARPGRANSGCGVPVLVQARSCRVRCTGEFSGSSSPWCSSSRGIGAYAPPFPWGFILSLSATFRVAGLALRVKVEHPTV